MTQNTEIEREVSGPPDPSFTMTSLVGAGVQTVYVTGEFDVTVDADAVAALLIGAGLPVVVDMVDLAFMDCGGYRAIAAARREVQQHGNTFTIAHAHDGPARLLELLRETDQP